MIKFLMRKLAYRHLSIEKQNRSLSLVLERDIIRLICFFVFLIVPSLVTISLTIDIFFPVIGKMSILNYTMLISELVLLSLFYRIALSHNFLRIKTIILFISNGIYFYLYTKKGNAIKKEQFEELKASKDLDFPLYFVLKRGLYYNYCYFICFILCKTLRCGYMVYAKIKDTDHNPPNTYTMHVFFVNNEWGFDTHSGRQLPLQELFEIYNATVYKSFSYEHIRYFSYDEFRLTEKESLYKWCAENDCSLRFARE